MHRLPECLAPFLSACLSVRLRTHRLPLGRCQKNAHVRREVKYKVMSIIDSAAFQSPLEFLSLLGVNSNWFASVNAPRKRFVANTRLNFLAPAVIQGRIIAKHPTPLLSLCLLVRQSNAPTAARRLPQIPIGPGFSFSSS